MVVFLVDNLDATVLNELMSAGRLPNIKSNLFDRGVAVNCAVTTVPSITFAAITSLMTGQFPGHHRIAGNQWFDRNELRLVATRA